MDRGVEATVRPFARLECQRDDLQQLGAGLEGAGLVQAGELRLGAEAGEDRLQPVELVLGCGKLPVRLGRVHEHLDVRAHGSKAPGLHHDVLVTVRGGRLTTRTDGAAAACCAWTRFAAAICDCRVRSCAR